MNNERIRILTAVPAQCSRATAGEIISVDKSGLLVGCGHGGLLVTRIQLPGKNPVSIRDLLNARPDFFKPGAFLDSAVAAS